MNIYTKNAKLTILSLQTELHCLQESIVHSDGDKRRAITESAQNEEYIIRCIGQLQIDYKYVEHEYEQKHSEWGTGTVYCRDLRVYL